MVRSKIPLGIWANVHRSLRRHAHDLEERANRVVDLPTFLEVCRYILQREKQVLNRRDVLQLPVLMNLPLFAPVVVVLVLLLVSPMPC